MSSIPNYNRLGGWPLQFLRTGTYYRSYGYLGEHTTGGGWWSDAAESATDGRYLRSWAGNIYARGSNFRGFGFALRCVVATPIYGIMYYMAW